MKNLLLTALFFATTLASVALAQRLPDNYPTEGFRTTGVVDGVFIEQNRIVIGDISYQLADSVVVHSMSARNVSIARLRPGVHVGVKFGENRLVRELWLLPQNYKNPRRQ